MPTVLTYWQLPEDEKEFFAYLETTGDVVVVPDIKVSRLNDLRTHALASYMAHSDHGQVRIGLRSHLTSLPVDQMMSDEHGVVYGLQWMQACVISYRRGQIYDGKKLPLSNCSSHWSYPDPITNVSHAKDSEFMDWGKKVFAWLRRFTPETCDYQGHNYRATQRVKRGVLEGKIEVVAY